MDRYESNWEENKERLLFLIRIVFVNDAHDNSDNAPFNIEGMLIEEQEFLARFLQVPSHIV